MEENIPDSKFGQELLTQELVTFEKIHVNVSQTLIITTEDRMHLWLNDLIDRTKKRSEWIAPASLFVAIVLTLTTATFKKFVLPADTWRAIFAIFSVASFIWFLKAIFQLKCRICPKEEILKLKADLAPSKETKEGSSQS